MRIFSSGSLLVYIRDSSLVQSLSINKLFLRKCPYSPRKHD